MNKHIIRSVNSKTKNRAYGILFGVIFCLIISFGASANATLIVVDLTKEGQGEGNKGQLFRPIDEAGNLAIFEMSAMARLNPGSLEYDKLNPAPWSESDVGPGTVYIAKEGAGVQSNDEGGSSGISGGGPNQNEELIFSFDDPVLLADVTLGIANIELKDGSFGKDDPLLFIHDGLLDVWYTLTEENIATHFVQLAGGKNGTGTVNFGEFISYLPDASVIDMFKIRETSGHIYVNMLYYSETIVIPEPATMVLLSLGSLALFRKRRP